MPINDRKIIHIDMDCFYAAVEVKYRPELRGRPIGVGGPPESRSVLCTANYEARKFGVRSAMSSAQAVRLCPDLILLPPHFDLYRKESLAVREIFRRFTDLIEPLSLDEAYLDVTHSTQCEGSATWIAREIRKIIYKELRLTASAGVAPNKFLAKIASEWNKPNGQFVLRPEDVASFVHGLKVEKIFGVGKVTARKMHHLGLFTCADIQRQSSRDMTRWFGARGVDLLELSHGRDLRPVESRQERKSLSVEETFELDLKTLSHCLDKIPSLFSEWLKRIQKIKYEACIRGHFVKLKYFDFKTATHESANRYFPTEENFANLLRQSWQRRAAPVRLLGLGVRLSDPEARQSKRPFVADSSESQLDLFQLDFFQT